MAISGFRRVARGVGRHLLVLAPRAIALRHKAASLASTLALLKNPRLAFGMLSIFIYVGAEVSIGSVMANYLMLPHTLGLAAQQAGEMVSLYWGGAMIGRFIGSAALRYVPAGRALTVCAIIACVLAATSALSAGAVAAVTLLAIGLFNSIQFPTIFTLAIEGEEGDTPEASALLCMAIVGGAVIPLDHRRGRRPRRPFAGALRAGGLLCLDRRLRHDRPAPVTPPARESAAR